MLVHPARANAATTFAWSSVYLGVDLSGTATFSTQVDGGGYDLVIQISNTGDMLPTSTAQILTGLYFDLSSGGALSMVSAVANLGMLTNGSSLQTSPTSGTANTNICAPGTTLQGANPICSSGFVAGGWEATYNSTGLGGGAAATQHWGIGTTGQGGVFSGNGNNAGAFEYGIAPVVGVNPTQAGGLNNAYPPGYVYETATFVLSGLTTSNITISNVGAAYGTAPETVDAATNITQLTATPEPASAGLLFVGAGLLLSLGLRRKV